VSNGKSSHTKKLEIPKMNRNEKNQNIAARANRILKIAHRMASEMVPSVGCKVCNRIEEIELWVKTRFKDSIYGNK
jgi:hypothetical protein